jgi:peptidoglycan/LPS O-acetylase OafA/YrhL
VQATRVGSSRSTAEKALAAGVLVALAVTAGYVVWGVVAHADAATTRSWVTTVVLLTVGVVVAVLARRARPTAVIGPAVVLLVTFGLVAVVNRDPGRPENPSECATHYALAGHSGRYQTCVDRWRAYVEAGGH